MFSRWDIWETAVIPALKNFIPFQGWRYAEEYEALVAEIEAAIRVEMQERGFLPPGPAIPPPSEPGDGEPVVRMETPGDPDYPILDVPDIKHVDGVTRLHYPSLDGGPKT